MAVIDLYNPDTYVLGAPHDEFTRLRREDPVHWQDIPGQAGYWARGLAATEGAGGEVSVGWTGESWGHPAVSTTEK
jgi:hypothetical protein